MAKIPKRHASKILPILKRPNGILVLLVLLVVSTVKLYSQPLPEISCRHKQAFHHCKSGPADPLYQEYDISFYWLNLSMERNTVDLSGFVEIQGKSMVNNLDTLLLELHQDLVVDSILMNDHESLFVRDTSRLMTLVNPALSTGDPFVIRVYYHGTPPTGGFFAGISTAVSTQWGNEVTWTLSEPFNAFQWFPVKQDLKDKADSAWIFITTDTSNMAGSNGKLTAITPLPGGKHRFEWKTSYPIDYYLISSSVADYQDYTIWAYPAGAIDSIPVVNYIYDAPGCLAFYQADLDRTPDFLELFSEKYGLYPFAHEKYGHCQVHLGGGMEHQTMSTMGAFNFDINSHELSHQWFGDNVTCATWSDIWVNEGFATYSQYIAVQYLTGQTQADDFMINMENYVMSIPDGSVYIPPADATDVWRIFDGRLSYNKGAVILHVLRNEINNDSQFFEIMKQYQEIYHGGIASGADFIAIAENISGLDLDDYLNQWYYGEGYPIYDFNWLQANDTLYISAKQTTSTTVTPFFRMSVPYRLIYQGGDTVIRLEQLSQNDLFKVPVKPLITSIEPNPRGLTLLKVGNISQGIGQIDPGIAFTAFPNPFYDELRIFFRKDGKVHSIKLLDISGREVLKQSTKHETMRINTTDIKSGMYFLVYGDDKGSVKLIRK